MTTLARYWLLQIPGILLAGVVLVALTRNGIIGATVAWTLLALWLAKDMALYPLYRTALGPPPPTGVQALVGQEAVARTEVTDDGLVRVRGELWRANALNGRRIRPGTAVVVVAASGLRLVVKPAAKDV